MSNAAAVEALFFAALEKKTAAERAAYLDSACRGNAELRRQVEKMLHAHPRVGDFLQKPAAEQFSGAVEPPDGTQAFNDSTPGPSDRPAGAKGPSLARTEGGQVDDDEENAFDFLQPALQPDELGRLGGYRVLKVLGQGGMGMVFQAEDVSLERLVALKVMKPRIARNPTARQRFIREAKATAKLKHDHIVSIYQVGEDNGVPFLAMEFLQGMPLDQYLGKGRKLTVPQVLRIGREMARGLAAAHEKGLIHRDIKPANVWLEHPTGRVKILDFGLARTATEDVSLTQSGAIMGTPTYMSPEQARSEKTVDGRTDLFSLGCVLYRLCAGNIPFQGDTTMAVLLALATDTPKPVREVNPSVPEALAQLIDRLLAKKPDDRPATAKEVVGLIQELEKELASEARPAISIAPNVPTTPARIDAENRTIVQPAVSSPQKQPPAPSQRRPRFRIGWVAAVLLLLFGGFGLMEATGVTHFSGAVIRLFSPEGTLVVEVDDPGISVQIDGSEVVITGAGAKEIRLKPGSYTIEARKDGKVVRQELVNVTKNGRQVVRVSQEASKPLTKPDNETKVAISPEMQTAVDTWIKAVAILPLDQQGVALAAKLAERQPGFEDAILKALPGMSADRQVVLLSVCFKNYNPAFDGNLTHKIEGGVVTSLNVPPLVRDLTPLRALTGLRTLTCRSLVGYGRGAENDLALLRSLKALENFNGQPVAQFWKDLEARQAAFKEWLQRVPVLTADQQVTAVAAKLKERNPGFDGKATPKIEGGVVTELSINGKDVLDLSPVRALVGLKGLNCIGAPLTDLSPLQGMKFTSLNLAGCNQLQDLSPLQGMSLTSLYLHMCPIQDLTPLKGMPLTSLNLHDGPQVVDLSPLKGLPLTSLMLGGNPVRDLSALKGLPLTELSLCHCGQVVDLSPLKGMALTHLQVDDTQVRDLEPLKGMPLKTLYVYAPGITDLKPLQGMPLEDIRLTPKNITQGLEILRKMKSLNTIGLGHYQGWPAAEFWTRFDKGEFGTPAVPIAHDSWIAAVAALPLDKQGEALAAKMKERLPGFEDAFLKAMAAMPADRQLVLLATWLPERNPGFDGKFTHKIEGGVVASLEVPPLVQDLTPLRALTGLRTLTCRATVGCDNRAESDAALLRSLKVLEKINGKPAAQFWKEVEARQAEFKEWLQQVPVLAADQQVAAVAVKLKERNPGFDGQVTHRFEGGVVTELFIGGVVTDKVTDLSPVQALAGLKVFGGAFMGKLTDLSPLKDLKLTSLSLQATQVADLTPLKDMKLTNLSFYVAPFADLSPLRGNTTLTTLGLNMTGVAALAPLKGMPLTSLDVGRTPVTDLAPLKDLPLTSLICAEGPLADLAPLKDNRTLTNLHVYSTSVKDLAPLSGKPLKTLWFYDTGVTDLSPLQSMKLEDVRLTPARLTQGLEVLRGMASLKTIGIGSGENQFWPAAEFWARFDKGEFKK